MTDAYPLTWPQAFPRTKIRTDSQFKSSLSAALANVQRSLAAFARDSGKPIASVVISSNCSLGNSRPEDPGVAVWFAWDGLQVCIPVDRYKKVEDNLQAIHHVLEARRTELRHGTLALVRATFTGFSALPPPTGARSWRAVLGVGPTAQLGAAENAYKEAAKTAHPDNGGTHERMAELNAAIAQARRELRP